MKRVVIGGLLCVVGLAGPAVAADLRAKAPVATAPAWNWSGGYIGLHGGYGWGSADHSFTPFAGNFAPAGAGFDTDIDGGIGGFHTGWNWQVGNVVFGLEGTTAWSSIEGKDAGLFAAFPNALYKTEVEDLSTFVARLGFANGGWLVYGKGGIAYGEVKSTLTDAGGQYFRERNDHVGWTVGAGLEYALSPNWILGLEYNYVDLGDQRYGGFITNLADYTADITFSTVLARVSYKFGAGGNPLTAAILGPDNPSGIWNGLYAGIHGGYGWGTDDRTVAFSPGGAFAYDLDLDGGVFGGQIGYLGQIGNWVIGTEFAASWTGVSETTLAPALGITGKTELNWLASSTLRVGYSWGPWLVYGKGGGAVGEVDSTFTTGASLFKQSNDHIGWTIGGGIEYAWGSWLVGVEYNYYDLGDEKYGGFGVGGATQWAYKTDLTVSTALARLSYKFGAPAPVVAKY